ncbi:hypothetical protein ACQCN2_18710 [Brevibacillus ginsengisoli]|uniref:hypothetical protein n=1 Tax=Brevibacillus ginsengisoli TaxID=363854 RepID=UPI003CF098DD
MVTVFIEYQIEPDKRNDFLRLQESWEEEVRIHGGLNFRFYEGVDQQYLFVEEFEVNTMEQYQQFKSRKTANESFSRCVKGGAAKIHIWAFQQVSDYKKE